MLTFALMSVSVLVLVCVEERVWNRHACKSGSRHWHSGARTICRSRKARVERCASTPTIKARLNVLDSRTQPFCLCRAATELADVVFRHTYHRRMFNMAQQQKGRRRRRRRQRQTQTQRKLPAYPSEKVVSPTDSARPARHASATVLDTSPNENCASMCSDQTETVQNKLRRHTLSKNVA
ncbi:hypothetical protein BCV70DRAFT_52563 [Testicularia cyperi]|uniref:Secreted protein n=1 Tax=Testicularia cyperi TaxID=1882483 RepID=A0A317XU37_9BASI|nr:hypothetical protein BCV70DRAFT_52563 [Testicularia cyperi]